MNNTKPLNFPLLYGKLGNWPGTMGPQAAAMLLAEIAKLPQGSTIVEYCFDGGRTSAVIGWGCKAGGHSALIAGNPSPDGMSEVWFNRLVTLFDLRSVLERYQGTEIIYADISDVSIIVLNPGFALPDDWRNALKVGGKIFYVAEARVEEREGNREGMEIEGRAREIHREIKGVAETDALVEEICNAQSENPQHEDRQQTARNSNILEIAGKSKSQKKRIAAQRGNSTGSEKNIPEKR